MWKEEINRMLYPPMLEEEGVCRITDPRSFKRGLDLLREGIGEASTRKVK